MLERLISHRTGSDTGRDVIEAHRGSPNKQFGGAPYVYDPAETLTKEAMWSTPEAEEHMGDSGEAMRSKYNTMNAANAVVASSGGTSNLIGDVFRKRHATKRALKEADERYELGEL